MTNAVTRKVVIQVETAEEQEENLKNQRKTLKVLQPGATDKENLAGRPFTDKLSRIKAKTDIILASTDFPKRKKLETRAAETQTSPKKDKEISVEELTSNEPPSEVYWEKLAEKRREALEKTLEENQHLHERIDGLEEELNTSRQMLAEARNLVEVLTEMLNENEAERDIGNQTKVTEEPKGEIITEEEHDEDSGKDDSFKTP